MKKLIWSNSYETAEEIREYVLANSEEFEEDGLSVDDFIDAEIYSRREDEKDNLSVQLDHDIVIIGTYRTWNGGGHNVARIGRNLAIVIDSPYNNMCDESIFCDQHNVCYIGHHHDGTNSAIYREMKDDSKYSSFINALQNAEGDERKWKRALTRYTKSLRPDVAKIYGW